MPTRNPFWHGTPVPPEKLSCKDSELR